jgi:hypothetical protein
MRAHFNLAPTCYILEPSQSRVALSIRH